METKKNSKYTKMWIVPTILVYVVSIAILLWGMCSFFASCSPRIVEKVVTEYRDSTIYMETTKDSLVYVPIPLEANQVIANVGDTSKLETSVAWSEAFLGSDGFLHHSLENKRENLPVVVPVTSKMLYSGVTNNQSHTVTKIEYREKSLSWWQSFKLDAFWWLVGATVVLIGLVFLIMKLKTLF